MEIAALKFVGRNQKNEVVDESAAKGAENVRLCIMNPSWILGPQLQPGDISGNGLPWEVFNSPISHLMANCTTGWGWWSGSWVGLT